MESKSNLRILPPISFSEHKQRKRRNDERKNGMWDLESISGFSEVKSPGIEKYYYNKWTEVKPGLRQKPKNRPTNITPKKKKRKKHR